MNINVTDFTIPNDRLGFESNPIKDSAVAFYKLDDPNDSIGTRHLTPTGTVTYVNGTQGKAVSFGVDNANGASYLGLTGNSFGVTNQNAFSISLWANSQQVLSDEEQDVMVFFRNNGYGGFFLRYYKATGVATGTDFVRNNGLSQEGIGVAHNPGTGTWNHYVIAVFGSTMYLYINKTQYTATCSTTPSGSNTEFYIGNGNGGFDGYIDEVAVFNVAVSQADVNAIYDQSNLRDPKLSIKNYLRLTDNTAPADVATEVIPKLYISKTDSTTPTDSVVKPRLFPYSVSVNDSTTPTDTPRVVIPKLYITGITDGASAGDRIRALNSDDLVVMVGDSTEVGERGKLLGYHDTTSIWSEDGKRTDTWAEDIKYEAS